MGSFINHKSNISALESKLQKIGRQIAEAAARDNDDDDDAGATTTLSAATNCQREQAQSFLTQQRNRVVQVERELLRLTYTILPEEADTAISLKELSRAIYELQNFHIRRLTEIRNQVDPPPDNQQQEQENEEKQDTKTTNISAYK